jgi:hypothetical protein
MTSNKRLGAGQEDLNQTFTGVEAADISRLASSPNAPANMLAADANMKKGDNMLSRHLLGARIIYISNGS